MFWQVTQLGVREPCHKCCPSPFQKGPCGREGDLCLAPPEPSAPSPGPSDDLPAQGEEVRSPVLGEGERPCLPAWDGPVSTSPHPLWPQAGASKESGWAAFASLENLQRNYKATVLVCSLQRPWHSLSRRAWAAPLPLLGHQGPSPSLHGRGAPVGEQRHSALE